MMLACKNGDDLEGRSREPYKRAAAIQDHFGGAPQGLEALAGLCQGR